jgi:hypothetical protein
MPSFFVVLSRGQTTNLTGADYHCQVLNKTVGGGQTTNTQTTQVDYYK